ncbi:Serralysin precursor [Phocoenobacter uteri]|uniref:Serralysin n=1 Tax=Phocoenobacter uteri TaxID=146806 RepID=A0A379C8E1_9PAST|nr:VCBS domain-containing protein [Phocoenobacter uteri]MDG6882376.1 hypothetical protein [Phocoenobacter uteri]SUB58534.1 Serralysin precursor [Phocoenobacter uteri]
MKNIQVILHDNKEVTEVYNVVDGQQLIIQNTRGVNYELFNALNGSAPQNIIAKRDGQDLFIILDENEGSGSPDEVTADVVIKGYYGEDRGEEGNTDATGILVGLHENGKYYAYIPESAESQDAVSILEDGMAEPQAIGGEEISCGFFIPWWAFAGLLALAIGGAIYYNRDKDDSEPSTPVSKPTVTVEDAKVVEGNKLVHKVTLSKTSTESEQYSFNLEGGTAVENKDFKNLPEFTNGVTYDPDTGTITVPQGVTSFEVSYPTKDDRIYEKSETTKLTIGGDTGTGTITDEDQKNNIDDNPNNPDNPKDKQDGDKPVVSITAEPSEAVEGSEDKIIFKVSQNNESNFDTTVTAKLVLGDIEIEDIQTITFTDGNGTVKTISLEDAIAGIPVTIPAGSKILPTFEITPKDDSIYEKSESFSMTLSDPKNASLGKETDTATIKDEDQKDNTADNPKNQDDPADKQDGDKPVVSIAADPSEAVEGSEDKIIFKVSQNNESTVDTTVTAKLVLGDIEADDIKTITFTDGDGTIKTISVEDAIAGVPVTIPAGSKTSPTFEITPKDDSIYEKSESFSMTLSDPKNASLGKETDTATIKDEDQKDNTADNPENTDDSTDPVDGDKPVISLKATDKTAVEGKADDTIKFEVQLKGDTKFETKATVKLDLGDLKETDIQTIKFVDGNGDIKEVSVKDAIKGIEVTIPAGSKTVPSFEITPKDDAIYEKSESFTITLSDPKNASLGKKVDTATIQDEDQKDNVDDNPKNQEDPKDPLDGDKPSLTVGDATAIEGKPLVHHVKVNGDSETDITYPFKLKDGSSLDGTNGNEPAKVGEDYTNKPTFTNGVTLNADGTITVPAGVKSFDVTYPTIDNNENESPETTTLTIGNSSGIGEIVDNDSLTVNLVATDNIAIEGSKEADPLVDNKLVFKVVQTRESSSDTTAKIKLDLSAVEDVDISSIVYTNAEGEETIYTVQQLIDGVDVTIPANSNAEPTFTLTAKNDKIYEISEKLTLNMADVKNAETGITHASGVIKDEANEKGVPEEGDRPKVSIEPTVPKSIEGKDKPLEFTVCQDRPSNLDTTVKVNLGKDSTIKPTDIKKVEYTDENGKDVVLEDAEKIKEFLENGVTVKIPKGQTEAPAIKLTPADDEIYEKSEDVVLEISAPKNVDLGDDKAKGVIKDQADSDGMLEEGDKPTVSIEATVKESIEGDNTALEYVVSQDKESNFDTTVEVNLGKTSEIKPEDIAKVEYTNADGKKVVLDTADKIKAFFKDGAEIKIPAGSKEAPAIKLTPDNDDVYEKSEKAVLKISNPKNANLGDDTAQGVIKDEANTQGIAEEGDKPTLRLVATDDIAVEGKADDTIKFEVQLEGKTDLEATATVKLNLDQIKAKDIETILFTDGDGKTKEVTVDEAIEGISVTIPAGSKTVPSFVITPNDDAIYEKSEEFGMTLSDVNNANLAQDKDSATIKDEDQKDNNGDNPKNPEDSTDPLDGDKPTLTVGDAEAEEGDNLVHTVTVNGDSETDITYPFKLADGSAKEGKDYENKPTFSDGVKLNADGTITVPAGVKEFTVTYPTVEDKENEPDQTTKLTIGGSEGTGNIIDDDALKINLKATDPKAIEGSTSKDPAADNKLVFEVSQTTTSSTDTTAKIKLNLGTVEKDDIASITYTDTAGKTTIYTVDQLVNGVEVTIPAGSDKKPTFTFVAENDTAYEVSEKLTLNMSEVVNAKVGIDEAVGVIEDESNTAGVPKQGDKPTVSIKAIVPEATEGKDTPLEYIISQDNLSETDTTVNVKLASNSIAKPEDIKQVEYTNANGDKVVLTEPEQIKNFLVKGAEIKIPAGSKEAPAIKLTPKNDDIYEKSEDAVLKISDPEGADLGTATATGAIKDEANDKGVETEGDKPTVSIKPTVAESIEGTDKALEYVISQDKLSNSETTVKVKLDDASTIKPKDIAKVEYTNENGEEVTLTKEAAIKEFLENGVEIKIPAGEQVAPAVKLTPKNDKVYEKSEDAVLSISEPQGADLGTPTAKGVIKDEPNKEGTPEEGDRPTVSIEATVAKSIEGKDTALEYVISQDRLSNDDTTVKVNLGKASTIEPEDLAKVEYTDAAGKNVVLTELKEIKNFLDNGTTVKIKAGETDAPTIKLTPKNDEIYEKSEDAILDISEPQGADLGTPTATGVIEDEPNKKGEKEEGDKPTVSIKATVAKSVEGDDTALQYEITQDKLSELDSTVTVRLGKDSTIVPKDIAKIEYTDVNDQAVVLDDPAEIKNFLENGAEIKIPAGSKKAPVIKLTPEDDNTYEQSEDVVLEIIDPKEANLGIETAKGVIDDETNKDGVLKEGDKPVLNLVATDGVAIEGGKSGDLATDNQLVFTVNQVGDSAKDTTAKVKLDLGDVEESDIKSITYTNAKGEDKTVTVEDLKQGIDVEVPAGTPVDKMPKFTIVADQDKVYEVKETLTMNLDDVENATKGTDTAEGVIKDDDNATTTDKDDADKPVVNLVVEDGVAIEGGSDGDATTDNKLVFKVKQVGDSEKNTTAKVKLDLDEIKDGDIESITYTKANGDNETITVAQLKAGVTVEIPAGTTEANMPKFTIVAKQDSIYEKSETLNMNLSEVENATKGTDTVKGVIKDEPNAQGEAEEGDKPVVNIVATDPTAIEGGQDGNVTTDNKLEFKVEQVGESEKDTTAKVTLNLGDVETADLEENVTYTDAKGNTQTVTVEELKAGFDVEIPAGTTAEKMPKFTFVAKQDDVYEKSETLTMNLSDVENATPKKVTAEGTIKDDDNSSTPEENDADKPTLSINDVTVAETDEDQTVQFTVTQSKASEFDTTVDVAIENVNADTGDVTTEIRQVTIPKGQTTATIDVTVKGDDNWEPTETYKVKLSNPVNATIADGEGLGTITNDDIKANNDAGTAVEAGGLNNNVAGKDATGNVLNGGGQDVADDPTSAHATVTGIRLGSDEGKGDAGTVGQALKGKYGTLTLNTDGSYTYKVDETNADVQKLNDGETLNESFNYTMSDGTLSDDAVLSITIDGKNDAPNILEITSTRVSEEGLNGGIADKLSYNQEDAVVAKSINDYVTAHVVTEAKEATDAASEAAKYNKLARENPKNTEYAKEAEKFALLAQEKAEALSKAKEAVLPEAKAQAPQNSFDQTDEKVSTGTITFTDVDNLTKESFKIVPKNVDLTVQGQQVQWSWDEATSTLQGKVTLAGSTQPIDVLKVEVGDIKDADATGKFTADYKVTLQHAVDHEHNLGKNGDLSDEQNDEDLLTLNFQTVVNDGKADSLASNLTVIIEDDRPLVAEGKEIILLEPLTANIQLVLDTSGSMAWGAGKTAGEVTGDFAMFDVTGKVIELPEDKNADIYTKGVYLRNAKGEADFSITDPSGNLITHYQNKLVKLTYDEDKVGDVATYNRDLSRLEVMQNAILDMLEAYENVGSTYTSRFQLVDFDRNGKEVNGSKWVTAEQVREVLYKLKADGGTNYDDALITAMEVYDNEGRIPNADMNRTYFMTDGTPTYGMTNTPKNLSYYTQQNGYTYRHTGVDATYPTTESLGGSTLTGSGYQTSLNYFKDMGIQAGEEATWIKFLTDNKIEAFAYAMGNVPVKFLHAISHDGASGDVDPNGAGKKDGIHADFKDLSKQLVESIEAPESKDRDLLTGGNLAFDGGLGADEGGFASITVGGVTYTFNEKTNTVTASDGSKVVVSSKPRENDQNTYDQNIHLLTVKSKTTGGIFSVHLSDGTKQVTAEDGTVSDVLYTKGQYSYQTVGTVRGYKEPIYFNVRDNDGDIVAAEQLLDIYRLNAREDYILTSQDINSIEIDIDTLMANDTIRSTTHFDQAESPKKGLSFLTGHIGIGLDGKDNVMVDTDKVHIEVKMDDKSDIGTFNYGITDGKATDVAVVSVHHKVDVSSKGSNGIKGTKGDNVMIGNDEDEYFSAYSGNDVIQGGGGSDRLYGGSGDDILIFDLDDARLKGGSGTDTIRLDRHEERLDISNFLLSKDAEDLNGIEIIDLLDGRNNVLDISSDTVKKMTDSDNELFINAEKDDRIVLKNFVENDNSGHAGYNLYELDGAKVYVDIENHPIIY